MTDTLTVAPWSPESNSVLGLTTLVLALSLAVSTTLYSTPAGSSVEGRSMVTGEPDLEDVRKFFAALRRAQRDIDLRPEKYTHYFRNEFPVRYHDRMDTRRWGPGERLVFEPYSREVYEETFRWIADRRIFEGSNMGAGDYDAATLTLVG